MTTDIASLGLDIDTRRMKGAVRDIDGFQRKMAEVEGAATKVERTFSQMTKALAGFGLGLGAYFSVREVLRYGDAWAVAANQLKLAVDGAEELRAAQEGVFRVSQQTYNSFNATANLTSKIQRFAGEVTGSMEGTLELVETINKAVALGGTSAASAEAGLFQLNQALSAGALRGEELNSVMEQLPIVAKAIADGLGQPIGKLRELAAQGVLTTEVLIKALDNQADEVDAAFGRIDATMAQAGTKFENALTKMIGTAGAPIFDGIAQGLSGLADALGNDSTIAAATAAVQGLVDALGAVGAVVGPLVGMLPAVAAGFTAMLVVKTLAPAFVALELAMSGAVGRALVMERGLQLLTAGAMSTRAAVTGVVTALGGPLAVAVGVAVGAITWMATSARDAAADIRSIPEAIEEAVSRMRAALSKVQDDNPHVRAAGAEAVAAELNAAQQAVRDATKAFDEAVAARDIAYDKALKISEQRDIPLDKIRSYQSAIDLVNATRMEMEAAKSALDAVWYDVDNPPGVAKGNDKPIDLPDPIDKEALRKQKRELEQYFSDLEDFIAKVKTAQSERAGMLKEMADAMTIVERTVARGGTTEALEDQLDVLQDTNQLLNGPLKLAYAALAEKAEFVARWDAASLKYARDRITTAREQLRINTEMSRLPRLAEALAVSVEEFELTQATFDLMERMPGLTEDQVRVEAQKLVAIRRVTDELEKQAARARELAEAPGRNWIDGLARMSDDFWTDWVDKGWKAFDDLGDAFKDLWKQLASDMLRYAFEPIRMGIMNAMGFGGMPMMGMPMMAGGAGGKGAAKGAGSAGGGGDFFGSIFGFGGGGGFGGFNLGNMGSLLQMAVASQGSAGLGALGFLNGDNGLGGALSGMLSSVLGKELAKGLGGAIGDIFNPGNAMGGMFGSGLASLLGFNGKNAGIGGTIGGIAGSFFGPIGSAIGSFLGQALGSLIGPKPSDQGAVAELDSRGRVIGMSGGKRTSETEGAARSAADAIAQGQELLRKMGATLSATVDQLVIGTRDPSRFSLTGSAALISSGTTGDPQALVAAALRAVLDGANFASPALQGVADAMLGAGRSFEDTIEVLGTLADIIPSAQEPLSQWGEALKRLNETFEDLRKTTNGVAAAALNAAEAQAKAALRDDFDEAISDALMEAREPLKKQFSDLLDTQMQRVADAAALGGNLANVLALNTEELKDFIASAATNADVFSQLNLMFAELRAQAAGLGSDVAALDEAFAKARETITGSFDDSIGDEMARLSNPTLAALRQMLEGQKARLDQARALGANIAAVERLNALETQRFFEGLSEDQFAALGNYLGIIEDFTGRIGATLFNLRREIDDKIDAFDQQREDLRRSEGIWRDNGQALIDLRQDMLDRFSDLSPQASLDDLRQRFTRLTEDARAGNESAIAALPQVAEQLVNRSRELFGGTRDFRNDLAGVTAVLEEIGLSGIARADDFDAQLQTLEQQRDLLIEIRDRLALPEGQEGPLADALALIGEGNASVAALLRQYLELSAAAAGQRLPTGQIANAATAAAGAGLGGPSAPAPGTYAPLPIPGATLIGQSNGPLPSGSSPAPSPPPSSGTDNATADAIAELISVTQSIATQQRRDTSDLRHEIRRLSEVYQVAS